MKKTILLLHVVLAIAAVSVLVHAQGRRNRSVNRNGNGGPVTNCGDIGITFDREPALTEETELSLRTSQVTMLKPQMTNGGIYINGWDRNEYSVKTCKAVPKDDPDAAATLREITTVSNGSGQLTVNGPAGRDWMANLIIMVPRLTNMEVETRNGPVQLRDMAGVIRLTATNGPLDLSNVGGVVEANTTNGPISSRGGSGDQKVSAVNGPVHVELSGRQWDGPGLQVSTRNGPLSLSVPDGYVSAITAQTSERSPVNCSARLCAGATRSNGSPVVIRIGSGEPVVRVSTSNGPLSIQ